MKNKDLLIVGGIVYFLLLINRKSKSSINGSINDNVDQIYFDAIQLFEKYGYIVSRGANSKTDYGHSRYFYIRTDNFFYNEHLGLGLKVRVSDHSATDAYRIRTELMITDNKNSLLNNFHTINYFVNNNQYKINVLSEGLFKGKTTYDLEIIFIPENYVVNKATYFMKKPVEINPNININ